MKALEEIIEEIRQHPRLIIADDFEITAQRTTCRARDFRNGDPIRDATDDRLWLGLRIWHRRQPGRAATEFRTREALHQLVDSAFESALRSSVDPWFRFPLWKKPAPEAPKTRETYEYDSLFPKLNMIPDVFEESYETWELSTILHRKTEKFQLRHQREMHAARFAMLNQARGDQFWLHEDRALGRPLREREDWLEALLMQSVALAEGAPFAAQGKSHVLMSPPVAAALLKKMEPWFHADLVWQGRSPLCARREAPLFAPVIGIQDHGNHPDGPNAAPFDMEGALTQQTTVVQEGRLRDLLHDAYTAAKDNRISTGNYRRPVEASVPGIHASQLFFAPSTYRPAELCRAMNDGLILQSLDVIEELASGDTAFRVKGAGWRVAGGRPVEPLRDVALSFDLFELFQRAVEIGNDLTFYGCCGAPSILFENIPLGE